MRAVTQESDGPQRRLRGSAEVETTEMILRADEIDYNQETHEAEARGHVRYEHFYNGEKLQADRVEYNLEKETGRFYVVSGTSPAKINSQPGVLTTSNPFYFQGKWAERIQEKYILYDGFITDCKLPKPWWVIKGPKFDVIPGERAIAYRSFFLLKHIPLLYAPALYKSLKKSPRKSGFLTPNIGNSSRRGMTVGLGYYWAINRSYDLLYQNQYFTERGFAHHVDFRGLVTQRTSFNFTFFGVNDKGLRLEDDTLRKEGGYLVTMNGKSILGRGFQAGADVNYLSSFQFRQAFTESFHEAIVSETHSIGYITKHWSTYGFNAVAQVNENFQSATPNDTIVIRKLPEVEFLSRDHQVVKGSIPLWFSFESTAGLLRRNQPLFQTRQFVDREDLEPRVMTAFQWKGFHLVPSFSIRETHYGSSLEDGKVVGKNLLRSSREVNVDLIIPSVQRMFNAPGWLGVGKLKHVIEPRAGFRHVAGVQDFDKIIRFDETDLVSNTTEAEYSLTNRVYFKNKYGQVGEILSWEVLQRRYFDPDFGGAVITGRRNVVLSATELTGYSFLDGPRDYSPVISALRIIPKLGYAMEWRTDYDPVRGSIVNSGFSAGARFPRYFVSLGHNQVTSDPVLAPSANQFRAAFGIGNQSRKGWNTVFSAYYDYLQKILQYSTAQVTYNTDCCGFNVQYRRFGFGTRNENQFRVAFVVSNVGSFGTLRKQERIF